MCKINNMKFLEKDLEDIIFECDNKKLQKKGLVIYGNKRRQVRIGNYGFCDLITYRTEGFGSDKILHLDIYELKKDVLNTDALLQLARYIAGVKNYLKNFRDINIEIDVKGYLVGMSLDLSSDFIYLCDLTQDVLIFQYRYGLDGLDFRAIDTGNYSINEENFK